MIIHSTQLSNDIRVFDATSIILGLAVFGQWCGLLRFLSYLGKYNILLRTLYLSAPSVMRFIICTGIFYIAFLLCGWLVMGPYHPKVWLTSCINVHVAIVLCDTVPNITTCVVHTMHAYIAKMMKLSCSGAHQMHVWSNALTILFAHDSSLLLLDIPHCHSSLVPRLLSVFSAHEKDQGAWGRGYCHPCTPTLCPTICLPSIAIGSSKQVAT